MILNEIISDIEKKKTCIKICILTSPEKNVLFEHLLYNNISNTKNKKKKKQNRTIIN